MIKNKEKKFAKKLVSLLNKRGFIVKVHKSKTSKSIYLKIDNGLIPNVRISDHKRYNDDNCKYNIIKNYNGVRNELVKGKVKKYYNFNSIGRLITDIELERNSKILKIGYSKYKQILQGKLKRRVMNNSFEYYEKAA